MAVELASHNKGEAKYDAMAPLVTERAGRFVALEEAARLDLDVARVKRARTATRRHQLAVDLAAELAASVPEERVTLVLLEAGNSRPWEAVSKKRLRPDVGVTNARTEGCNRVIKQIKRVACGFRNQANYERRMLHSAALRAA
ncbi:MAG: transposase [Egibacteraceae bacterium]